MQCIFLGLGLHREKVFVLFVFIGSDFEGACLFHMRFKPTSIWTTGNVSTSILKVFSIEKLSELIQYRV